MVYYFKLPTYKSVLCATGYVHYKCVSHSACMYICMTLCMCVCGSTPPLLMLELVLSLCPGLTARTHSGRVKIDTAAGDSIACMH